MLEMSRIIQHISEDHGVPHREANHQGLTGSNFGRLAWEILEHWFCEVQKRLRDLSVRNGFGRSFGHLVIGGRTPSLVAVVARPSRLSEPKVAPGYKVGVRHRTTIRQRGADGLAVHLPSF